MPQDIAKRKSKLPVYSDPEHVKSREAVARLRARAREQQRIGNFLMLKLVYNQIGRIETIKPNDPNYGFAVENLLALMPISVKEAVSKISTASSVDLYNMAIKVFSGAIHIE